MKAMIPVKCQAGIKNLLDTTLMIETFITTICGAIKILEV